MSTWGALLVGAAVVAVAAALLRLYQWRSGRTSHSGRSVLRLGLGLGLLLATIAVGGSLTSVVTRSAPEQRGISVIVDGVTGSRARHFDTGLFVAADEKVERCGQPVQVRLTLDPTAEFWIDNHARLRDSGHVTFGIPYDHLSDIEVHRGESSAVPLPGSHGNHSPLELLGRPEIHSGADLTTVSVDVPNWGRTLDEVTVSFLADWTSARSRLGGCYLIVPALTGLPTALTGSRVLDLGGPVEKPVPDLPGASGSLIVVHSSDPDYHAYYESRLEVTSGVATLHTKHYTVDGSLSAPGPSTEVAGVPTWTCRSSILSNVKLLHELPSAAPAPDYAVTGRNLNGSFSAHRVASILNQKSCGSWVALDDPRYGSRRDLLLILVGAVFSLGIELLISGARRRHHREAE